MRIDTMIVCKDCLRVGYSVGRFEQCPCGSRNFLDADKQPGQEFIKLHALQDPNTVPTPAGKMVFLIGGLVALIVLITLGIVKILRVW
ncbi:MAG: hypothetical protein ACXU7D_00890 [Burkholderiaceae bacterium]